MYEEDVVEKELDFEEVPPAKNPCRFCGEDMDEKVKSALCIDCEMSLEED